MTSSVRFDVVIVEALGTGHGLRLVCKAVSMGAKVLFATSDVRRYAADVDRQLLETTRRNLTVLDGVPTRDVDAVTRLLCLGSCKGAGVIAQADSSLRAVAAACTRSGHTFVPPEVVTMCSDKAAFRARMEERSLPHPLWALANSKDELRVAATTVGLPAVVKPTRGTGSAGVLVVSSEDGLVEHGSRLLHRGHSVLVEEYLVGPLVSVELFRHEGGTICLGMTDRVLGDPPLFAELCWTFPFDADPDSRTRIAASATTALDAVGLPHGPAHVELLLTARGPIVVEVNARIAGRGLTDMVSTLAEYDEYALIVRQALGESVPAARPRGRGYMSECVIAMPVGARPSPDLIGAVARLPGIRHVRLGDPMRPPQDLGRDVDCGEVRAEGATFAEAQMRARAGAQALAISSLASGQRPPSADTSTMEPTNANPAAA